MKVFNLNKINSVLILGFAIILALHFGANFFIPLTFAIFLATLLVPLVNKFEKMGMGPISSSTIAAVIMFLAVSATLTLFFVQLQTFTDDLPVLEQELSNIFKQIQKFIEIQ